MNHFFVVQFDVQLAIDGQLILRHAQRHGVLAADPASPVSFLPLAFGAFAIEQAHPRTAAALALHGHLGETFGVFAGLADCSVFLNPLLLLISEDRMQRTTGCGLCRSDSQAHCARPT